MGLVHKLGDRGGWKENGQLVSSSSCVKCSSDDLTQVSQQFEKYPSTKRDREGQEHKDML